MIKKSCWIFSLVLIVLVIAEGLLRIIPVKDQLFIQSSDSGLLRLNEEFNGKVTHIKSLPPETIRKVKDKSCFRIFILGEAPDNLPPVNPGGGLGHLLNYQLQQTFRNKEIELVNIPGAGSSIRMLAAARQVINYNPDLIILCPGRNEFDDSHSFTGIREVDNFIQELYIFRLVKKFIPLKTLNHDFTCNSRLFENVTETFESRLNKTVLHLQREGIPIMLINTACNLLDTAPRSESFLSSDSTALKKLLEEGKMAYYKNDYDLAYTCFDRIYGKQRTHAETLYYLGRLALQQNDIKAAGTYLRQSADYDCRKQRPLSYINNSIFKISVIRNCPLINMEDLFSKNSSSGIPGYDLFSNENNTNLKGNVILSDACFKTILSHKFPGFSDISAPTAGNALTPFDIICDQFKSPLQNQKKIINSTTKPQNLITSFEEETARLYVDEKSSWEESMNKLYEYYLKNKNYRLAFKTIEKLILENPFNISINNKASRIAALLGDSQLVVYYATKAHQMYPEVEMAQRLFIGYLKLDMPEQALPYIEFARKRTHSGDLQLIYNATTQIINLKKVLKENPEDPTIRKKIIAHYLAMGNNDVIYRYQ